MIALCSAAEVLQCLEVLNEGCDGETAILPFLTHTFEGVGFASITAVVFYFFLRYFVFTYLKLSVVLIVSAFESYDCPLPVAVCKNVPTLDIGKINCV